MLRQHYFFKLIPQGPTFIEDMWATTRGACKQVLPHAHEHCAKLISFLPMPEARKPPAPWLFGLLILPLGIVVVGFNFTAFPLLLAQAGVPVHRDRKHQFDHQPTRSLIGFLFAGRGHQFRRRTWLVLASFGTALSASRR